MQKHPKANCSQCPLEFTGTYVPTEAPKDGAEYAVVGEAPGYYEAKDGKPFTSSSGKLLNATLTHNGIQRTKLMVTNAIACRPPDREVTTSTEIRCCRPRLLWELERNNVRKVLALGNVANESLLNETGINKLRVGQGRTSPYNDKLHVISSLHPSAILRVPDQVNYFNTDISKLTQEPILWTPPAYTVAKSEEDALGFLEQLRFRNVPKLVIDIETDIEKDSDFGQPNQMELLCVGVQYAKKKSLILSYEACKSKEVLRKLAELSNMCPSVGYQNGKFDQKGLYPLAGFIKMTFDTMLMSYCLNEYTGAMKPHSLEYLGKELVGAPDWKHVLDEWQPKKYGYGVVPKSILYQYNAYDIDITWDVAEILEPKLKALTSEVCRGNPGYDRIFKEHNYAKSLWDVHNMLIMFSQELMFVEMNGIGVDKNHLAFLKEDFQKQLDKQSIILDMSLPHTIVDVIGGKSYQPKSKKKDDDRAYNPGSPQQTKDVLKDFGAVVQSTDEDTLKFIIAKRPGKPVAEFCEQLLIHRGIAKGKSTYVDGIEKRLYAGRIYTNFLLTGTTNGRLSSRNPNLQNIPRGKLYRNLFVPISSEHVFVQADYAQAELRILGWLAGDSYFLPIFKEGIRDVFDELSGDLFPERPKSLIGAEAFKELRSKRVKPFVYGLAYGRTEYGLAADPDLGMTVHEAKGIMEKFLVLIPEIVEWQEWVKEEINCGRDLISPFGRRRRFPLITNDNRADVEREALSFLPSSTSSDIGLHALCRVRQDLKGIGWVRNFVHDSILVECHRNRVDEVSQILEGRMLEAAADLTTEVRFSVDVSVGNSWGEL